MAGVDTSRSPIVSVRSPIVEGVKGWQVGRSFIMETIVDFSNLVGHQPHSYNSQCYDWEHWKADQYNKFNFLVDQECVYTDLISERVRVYTGEWTEENKERLVTASAAANREKKVGKHLEWVALELQNTTKNQRAAIFLLVQCHMSQLGLLEPIASRQI